jgi:arylsulfatase A-like enzyme
LATLLDLAELELPHGFETLGASSLADTLRSGVEPRAAAVYSELSFGQSEFPTSANMGELGDRIVMVRDGSWKLSVALDREPRELLLVDLATDPLERVNRADDPAAADVCERLCDLVVEHVDGNQHAPDVVDLVMQAIGESAHAEERCAGQRPAHSPDSGER